MTNTERFVDKVNDYVKYRPHYPSSILFLIKQNIKFNSNWVVADIGSGTGISSKLFLDNGNRVIGIEPNFEMRRAAEDQLKGFLNFTSLDGTAEASQLPDQSVDLIFSGQAFHWFDKDIAKIEFKRILNPSGYIVLCWNQRDGNSQFQIRYEQILQKFVPDYDQVNHRNITDSEIQEFFQPKKLKRESTTNHQYFDLDGLQGRLRSSSYCPKENEAYSVLMEEIETLFHEFEVDGRIRFDYVTNIYYC